MSKTGKAVLQFFNSTSIMTFKSLLKPKMQVVNPGKKFLLICKKKNILGHTYIVMRKIETRELIFNTKLRVQFTMAYTKSENQGNLYAVIIPCCM